MIVAENIANLFEPELGERYNAFAFAKSLYDKRSRVLHGDVTDFSAAERNEARLTAAAALIAILERKKFISRTKQKNDEKPDDFFKKLQAHRYVEGPFLGVPVPPITPLWRDSQ